VQEVIGPDAIKVTLPSNLAGATRDLLSGRGAITVNGKPVDIAVLSSEKGEITVRVSNSLIPKVPLIKSSIKIPFSGTASDQGTDTSEADWGVLADVAGVFGVDLKTPFIEQAYFSGTQELAKVGRVSISDRTTPFFDQKFFGGLVSIPIPRNEDSGGTFTYVANNKDVAGVTSLTLGAAYGGSYAYYVAEEEAAEEKRAAAAKAKKQTDAKAKAAKAVREGQEKKANKKTEAEPKAEAKPEVDEAPVAEKEMEPERGYSLGLHADKTVTDTEDTSSEKAP